jgi:hypothetical protein
VPPALRQSAPPSSPLTLNLPALRPCAQPAVMPCPVCRLMAETLTKTGRRVRRRLLESGALVLLCAGCSTAGFAGPAARGSARSAFIGGPRSFVLSKGLAPVRRPRWRHVHSASGGGSCVILRVTLDNRPSSSSCHLAPGYLTLMADASVAPIRANAISGRTPPRRTRVCCGGRGPGAVRPADLGERPGGDAGVGCAAPSPLLPLCIPTPFMVFRPACSSPT